MKSLSLILTGALALGACTTAAEEGEANPLPRVEGECVAGPGQSFIGQKATAEVGQLLFRATGARTIRWVPPRTAVTMDFRPDRLTVYYDDDTVIERVSCT